MKWLGPGSRAGWGRCLHPHPRLHMGPSWGVSKSTAPCSTWRDLLVPRWVYVWPSLRQSEFKPGQPATLVLPVSWVGGCQSCLDGSVLAPQPLPSPSAFVHNSSISQLPGDTFSSCLPSLSALCFPGGCLALRLKGSSAPFLLFQGAEASLPYSFQWSLKTYRGYQHRSTALV